MLRVSPDGAVVWVQTAGSNDNVGLDVESMNVLQTTPVGRGPVQSAFGPAGSRYGLVMHLDETFVSVLDWESGKEIQHVDVGGAQANASFMPDGTTAWVTVTSRNEVVAIDMGEMAVVGRVKAGGEPMGLVVFDPSGS
jgi:DNA-binding beta-propeller fold protein YncE